MPILCASGLDQCDLFQLTYGSGVLEENNVPSDKVDLFVDVYAQKRRALQLLLSTTTFTFPNIVDVKWQLNYCNTQFYLANIYYSRY